MSIVGFHRFLITVAILFCAGFAAWEGNAYSRAGSAGSLALAIVFGVLTVLLGYYLANLNRFLGRH